MYKKESSMMQRVQTSEKLKTMKTTEKLNDAGSINITESINIKKLIMTQKLEPRTVGLKPTKIGHVDRVIVLSTA